MCGTSSLTPFHLYAITTCIVLTATEEQLIPKIWTPRSHANLLKHNRIPFVRMYIYQISLE